jgi:hypothetical protein
LSRPGYRSMPELNSDTLLDLGFVDVGAWLQDGTGIDYQLDGPDAKANEIRLNTPKALYAFVSGNEVQYVGKTARTIRRRFVGYRRPGSRQRTNQRCNAKISEAIAGGIQIRIFVFTPISHLRYQEFEIDLAAGLEDSLIAMFDPPWNGRQKSGQPLSEDTEREEVEEETVLKENSDITRVTEPPPLHVQPIATFSIKLGETYYNQGLITLGVAASQHLGMHGDPIEVSFDDGTSPVISVINRTANRSGGVRVVGRNQLIAHWFRRRFRKDEVVEDHVLEPNRILLLSEPTT